MSFYRFVYYCAILGGWAALLAWMLAEPLLGVFDRIRDGLAVGPDAATTSLVNLAKLLGLLKVMGAGLLVGAAIGSAVVLVATAGSHPWKHVQKRLPGGLVLGGLGGLLGGLLGELAFSYVGLPRAVGWMVMGLAIGCAEGLADKSARKLRNGLIGGGVGGLVGGVLFDILSAVMVHGSGMAARAVGFVCLGVAIGALIGLAQVVLKEAWLTVLDGAGPGRQLILGEGVTVLGRGDHLPLPLLGFAGRDLESEHARIVRRADGTFTLEDNGSRLGTRLNGQVVQSAAVMRDGDLIKLGGNILRFNVRHGKAAQAPAGPSPVGALPSAPPPATKTGPLPPPPPAASPPAALPSGAIRPPIPQSFPTKPPANPGNPRIPPPPPPPRRA